MEERRCLKVSYRGLLRFIIYETHQCYEDIIKMAMKRFEIPEHQRNAIQISNELGYVFDKQLFDYFIILFPNPQMIFYIRLDYSRLTSESPSADRPNMKNNAHHPTEEEPEDKLYVYVPVRRQNCFLGELPAPDVKVIERQREAQFAKIVGKRLKFIQTKKRVKNMRNATKRTLRV